MLTVNDEARDYILAKGGAVHILHNTSATMCCGRINLGPMVMLGKPPGSASCQETTINGITVFMPQDFYCRHPLTIALSNFCGLKNLRIDGWKLL